MNEIERVIHLARCSQGADVPEIDVRARVRTTLRGLPPEAPGIFDAPSLAVAGLSLAIMATMLTMAMPAISALRDPWAAYMTTPWSF